MSSSIFSIDQISDLCTLSPVADEFPNKVKGEKRPSASKVMQDYLLGIMVMFITCVSVYDVYWSFKTAAILPQMEENPLGRWLIQLDGGDISLFMTAKMVGTMFVILAIPGIYQFKRSWGMICCAAVAVFQCLLLVYFELGHLLF